LHRGIGWGIAQAVFDLVCCPDLAEYDQMPVPGQCFRAVSQPDALVQHFGGQGALGAVTKHHGFASPFFRRPSNPPTPWTFAPGADWAGVINTATLLLHVETVIKQIASNIRRGLTRQGINFP
jgi:hypothetical protein